MDHPALPDGFDYVGDVYRPPSEADSILIQATVGCSYGKCSFCSGHGGRPFFLKEQQTLERDFLFAERYCARQDRVFFMDGNALTMPMPRWQWLLQNVQKRLPWVKGAGAFGTGLDIAAKSDEELLLLRELGLDRLYVGIESGHRQVLEQVNKGISPERLREQCCRVKQVGMTLYVTVLLGIADSKITLEHARKTGELLSAVNPDVVTVMTLIPYVGTPVRTAIDKGELITPAPEAILQELRELLAATSLAGGLFDCSHSSGYLSFQARLPNEKEPGLALIDRALAGNVQVKPDDRRRI